MYHPKAFLKETIYKIGTREPILKRWRAKSYTNRILVLMYHEIADDHDEIEAWTVVKKSEFIKQMEYLKANFEIHSLQGILNLGRGDYKPSKPIAVLTFDDGYAGNYKVLFPTIIEMNIPATVFVATKAVLEQKPYWFDRVIHGLQSMSKGKIDLKELSLGSYEINASRGGNNWGNINKLLTELKRFPPTKREDVVDRLLNSLNLPKRRNFYTLAPLSVHQVREMAKCTLITIGAHSHCHNILTQISEDEMLTSISKSRQLLEEWTARPINLFSYPNGNYNEKVIQALQRSGFQCGMTTVSRLWDSTGSPYEIPRIGVGRYDSIDRFKFITASGVNV
jgi:peptidoglycan/xylan/chitin deacetylase (PgdA/CDA1 family)